MSNACCGETPCQWGDHPCDRKKPIGHGQDLKTSDGRPLMKELDNIVLFLDSEQVHASARVVEDAKRCLEHLDGQLNGALICAGVASKERGEWAAERDELLSTIERLKFDVIVERAKVEADRRTQDRNGGMSERRSTASAGGTERAAPQPQPKNVTSVVEVPAAGGVAPDQDARWQEIQRLSDAIASKDGAPTELESALCGAVWRAKTLERELQMLAAEYADLKVYKRMALSEESSMIDSPALGDYVLATKYNDGDPGDAWALGFYDGERDGRHFVKDSDGKQIRANGFRRVARIRADVGHWLIMVAATQLEKAPPGTVNLWAMLTPFAFDLTEDLPPR